MKVHTSQSARAHFRSISRALHSAGDHPQHTGDDSLLDSVLSVEEVGVYKSHPKVYQLAVDRPGLAASAIAFQSSNAWDAYAASAFGMKVVWCNRYGQRRERLPGAPNCEVQSLAELPAIIHAATRK